MKFKKNVIVTYRYCVYFDCLVPYALSGCWSLRLPFRWPYPMAFFTIKQIVMIQHAFSSAKKDSIWLHFRLEYMIRCQFEDNINYIIKLNTNCFNKLIFLCVMFNHRWDSFFHLTWSLWLWSAFCMSECCCDCGKQHLVANRQQSRGDLHLQILECILVCRDKQRLFGCPLPLRLITAFILLFLYLIILEKVNGA